MNLEGLRGVAAIVVVFYHAITMFYPGIAYGVGSYLAPVQNMRFEDNLHGNPLNVFLSGGFAVGIFFVLSGFVLSVGFFQTANESVIKKLASKRYLRLMLPALAATVLSYVVLKLNLNSSQSVAMALTHSRGMGDWSFSPSLFEAIKQGTYDIFLNGKSFYNPVLWTMMYEFAGSFIVFIVLLVFGKSKYRGLLYLILGMLTCGTWYFGFILGMALADTYINRNLQVRINSWRSALLLLAGLLLGGYPFGVVKGTIYEYIHLPLIGEDNTPFYISLGAVMVVTSILTWPRLSSFFAKEPISRLGKYTYSLYLTHYLILMTVGLTVFVKLVHHFGLNKSVLVTMVITLPVIAGVAWLFERYVDTPAIRFSRYVSKIIEGTILLDTRRMIISLKEVGARITMRVASASGSKNIEIDEE